MRLLLLSDIHGNIDALEACLAAAPSYDECANLGDVVGYGGAPNEVVERVRPLASISVRGNHDRASTGLSDLSDFNPIAAAAARWTADALSAENRDWVAELPRGPITDGAVDHAQFVHGSPLDEDAYLLSAPMAEMAIEVSPFHVTFFGHTHVQCWYSLNGREFKYEPLPHGKHDETTVTTIQLERGSRYLINPGSVGQPRDADPRSGFAVYDTGRDAVEFYRVPYNISQAQQRIVAAGLPIRLAARLAEGR